MAVVLLIAFSAIYIPSVGHGFIKDDFEWIAHSRIDSPVDVVRLLRTAPSGFYRPMVSLSFGANYLACGLHPLCYGMTNFVLAVACAVGVYVLARALDLPRGGALLAAAMWAFNWHGINMALLWISGRTALVLVLFATFAAAAFVRRRFWLAAALCFGAMLSKEEAVLLPFILVASVLVDRRADRPASFSWLVPFVAGAIVAEGVYLYLRLHSGAFTPATAPSFYRFTFSATKVGSNLFQYFDRSATFAILVVFLWVVFTRARVAFTPKVRTVIVFGVLWWVGTLAITVFLPVRSSLYALLPSVGIALVVAAAVAESFAAVSPHSARRAVLAGLMLAFLCLPIYAARNRGLRAEAELSTATLKALQRVASARGPGTVVRLRDNRAEDPSLIHPFGTFIQDAANLVVSPRIVVSIEPPPGGAPSAAPSAPLHVDAELELRNGKIVQTR